MSVRNLQGTPWHAERVHRDGDDARRYKGRCKHYRDQDEFCDARVENCIGSAHCLEYEAMTDEEFKRKQQKKRQHKKQIGEDDCYWY